MQEIKFSYNPFNKEFIKSAYGFHASDLRGKDFKSYIRGAIIEGVLYLRAFYPFEPGNLEAESLQSLYNKSAKLLEQFRPELLKAIKKNIGANISSVVFNADKDLKGQGVN
jgi:hypothetical protein